MIATGLAWTGPAGAVIDDPDVRAAKEHLTEVRERLWSRRDRVRAIQRRINKLATRISETEAALARTELALKATERRLAELSARRAEIQAEIDRRSRRAYILGPATAIHMALDADSYVDLTRGLGLLEFLNWQDGELVEALAQVEAEMNLRHADLERLELQRRVLAMMLRERHKDLRRAFAKQRRLLAKLRIRRDFALAALSRVRPFAVCPVKGPHAIADDFGARRVDVIGKGKHKRERVRKHQGNDIFAPAGTPIVAPFEGVAVTTPNKLGGMAVKVIGEFGYVYNAHLSRYGTLGRVDRGDVVGYVGDTGNAEGTSPHNHFEWHPSGGAAVDPHHFLLLVC